VEGALFTVHALKAKLPGGYHRDFQFLKAPLMRGIELTDEMLAMLTMAVPRLEVDRAQGRAALTGDILATDEALRRTTNGVPFREAYRAVASELKRGISMPALSDRELIAARGSTGGIGNLGLGLGRARVARARRWWRAERRRLDDAMLKLAGRRRG